MVRSADWLVDVGPGAGTDGGQVLHSGPVADLQDVPDSVDPAAISRRTTGRPSGPSHGPRAAGCSLPRCRPHNLHDLDVDLPLGTFTAVTGRVRGGEVDPGHQVLADTVRRHLGLPDDRRARRTTSEADEAATADGAEDGADGPSRTPAAGPARVGLEAVRRLVVVDQRPIGRTPRSNLATYTGLFDAVRSTFARTPEARRRHWTASRFSFNVAAGPLPDLSRRGVHRRPDAVPARLVLALPDLPRLALRRRDARGHPPGPDHRRRAGPDVDAAVTRWTTSPPPYAVCTALRDVGLGYLRLGQPATELSGGEAQRIKLATELQRTRLAGTLYLLDEPTTGLHPADVERLLRLLQSLVDAGSTVVVVEHDAAVALAADWLVDLGPGGGDAGGRVVDAGPPVEVVRRGLGPTADHLARRLA